MAQNTFAIGLRYFFFDLFGGIIVFPFWWYSRGLVRAADFCISSINNYSHNLAISIWIKNIAVPMYGEYNIQGRIISFFMRFVQIVFRSVALVIYTIFMILVFFAYLVLPAVAILGILYNFGGAIFIE